MMPNAYRELAGHRSSARWSGYQHPEDFGYHFREWVSPYTKGAHALGGVAIILQDWSSADVLSRGPDPDTQEYGRTRSLPTNRRLEALLGRVLGLTFTEVYVTNVFPFIKQGGVSSPVPRREAVRAANEFAKRELEIVRPTVTLPLGSVPHIVLSRVGVQHISLPHPAARIGDTSAHERRWRQTLEGQVELHSK